MIHDKNTRYTVQAQGSYFFCSSLKASNSTLASVCKIYVTHKSKPEQLQLFILTGSLPLCVVL